MEYATLKNIRCGRTEAAIINLVCFKDSQDAASIFTEHERNRKNGILVTLSSLLAFPHFYRFSLK